MQAPHFTRHHGPNLALSCIYLAVSHHESIKCVEDMKTRVLCAAANYLWSQPLTGGPGFVEFV